MDERPGKISQTAKIGPILAVSCKRHLIHPLAYDIKKMLLQSFHLVDVLEAAEVVVVAAAAVAVAAAAGFAPPKEASQSD